MRDAAILQTVNQAVGRLAHQVDKALGRIAHDMTELSNFVAAETMRRQVLEDVLFSKSTFLGGLDKDEFEKRFLEKVEEYKKNVTAEVEATKKAQEEAKAEIANADTPAPAKTLYGPDGAKVSSHVGEF